MVKLSKTLLLTASMIVLSACSVEQPTNLMPENLGPYDQAFYNASIPRPEESHAIGSHIWSEYNSVNKRMTTPTQAFDNAIQNFFHDNTTKHERDDSYWKIDKNRQTLRTQDYAGARDIDPEDDAKAHVILYKEVLAYQDSPSEVGTYDKQFDEAIQNIEQRRAEKSFATITPIRYPNAGGDLNQDQSYKLRQIVRKIKTGDVYNVFLIQGSNNQELYERQAESLKQNLTNLGVPSEKILVSTDPFNTIINKENTWIEIHPDLQGR